MNQSHIDFHKISQALSGSLEAIKSEQLDSNQAIESLTFAQETLQQALNYSLNSNFTRM